MKVRWFIILILFLSSCSWIEENMNGDDLTMNESYQIGNVSSDQITLHFYSNGVPKNVYAEVYNQTAPVYVTQENAVKPRGELLNVNNVSLMSGQTILFYELVGTYDHTHVGDTIPPTASSLHHCGYGSAFYNLFRAARDIIGDSVVITGRGRVSTTIPMTDMEIWDTWYDNANYIYHHFWPIGD